MLAIPKRVAFYVRTSSGRRNHVDENSLSVQLDRLTSYAKSQGWDVAKVYKDEGLSSNRPALTRLMDDAKAGKFEVVLIYRYDRITRSVRDLIDLIEEFEQLSIGFVSVKENVDTSTPLGRLMMTFVGGMLEFERQMPSDS